jgi:hypothetical protein
LKLGDFFKTATHANPVNPRSVTLTCISRAETLPDGSKNPPGRVVRATVTGALVFLNGDETLAARAEARRALRDRLDRDLDEDSAPEPIDPGDLDIEIIYQILQRVVREWDADNKKAGDPLFPTVDVARELIVPREANRLYTAWGEYVADEHPEGSPTSATFRGSKARGSRLAGRTS